MAKYIDRKAALSLDLCIGINCQDCPFKTDLAHSASGCKVEDFMNAIPAADVAEVVRCRDCKYTNRDGADDPAIYCKQWDRWEMPPEAYCWLGKRKDGGQD